MANNIQMAVRSLGQKSRHNIMKIASLAIGLAVGLVLIAKACFEQSFDDFYPEGDRVYRIYEKFLMNGQLKPYPHVAGGVTVYMKEMMPEIEAATRFTALGADATFTLTESQKKLKAAYVALADSNLFDVLPRPILQGDAKEALSRPMYVMVSDELAEKMGGDVVGRTFSFDGNEKAVLTIGGVFERYPENSSYKYDIYISMPSIKHFTWDGSLNLVGNDRYVGLVKLHEGVSIAQLEAQIPQFIETYLPTEELQEAGVELSYEFQTMQGEHERNERVQSMILMLSLIAFALIFVAVMNYILITVSSVVGRSKEVAVRKCYGASVGNIHGLVFAEAFVHVVIALFIAFCLLVTFQDFISHLLGVPIGALLFSRSMLILLAVCLGVLLLTGLLPGSLYARIPVAAAFRSYRESRRIWKLALLFIQFTAATFLVILLFIINKQYHRMTNDDPGYVYENLAYIPLEVLSSDTTARQILMPELERLAEVAQVTFATDLPMRGSSGDNVMLPGSDRELFNCADQFYVGPGFFDLMEIPIVEGRAFNPELGPDEEIMVSRRFVEYMERTAGWTGSPIGRQVCVTSHNGYNNRAQTICGVFEDYRIGSIAEADDRPIALFFAPTTFYNAAGNIWGQLLIKYHRLTPEAMQKTNDLLARLLPTKDVHVYSYKSDMQAMYEDTRNFRDAVLVGGFVTLAIVVIGLMGYTTDEVNRRRKEIAIRRIHGALMTDVQRLFLRDVVRMAFPASLLGIAIAWKVAEAWQLQFSEKVPLSWYIFIGGMLLVHAVILAVSSYNVHRIAYENPSNSLKTE